MPQGYFRGPGSTWYKIVETSDHYPAAKSVCELQGAQLPGFKTQSELDDFKKALEDNPSGKNFEGWTFWSDLVLRRGDGTTRPFCEANLDESGSNTCKGLAFWGNTTEVRYLYLFFLIT